MANEKKNVRQLVFQAVEVTEKAKSVKVKTDKNSTVWFKKEWKGTVKPGTWYQSSVYDSEFKNDDGEMITCVWVEHAFEVDESGAKVAQQSTPAQSAPASAPASKPATGNAEDPRGHSILAQMCYKSACHIVNGLIISGRLDVNLTADPQNSSETIYNAVKVIAHRIAKDTLTLAAQIKAGEVK